MTSQFSVDPSNTVEGEDAILYARDLPPDAESYWWYRGQGEMSRLLIEHHDVPKAEYARNPFDNTRQRVIHREFLVLRAVSSLDEGIYTVVAHLSGSRKKVAFGQLTVYGE